MKKGIKKITPILCAMLIMSSFYTTVFAASKYLSISAYQQEQTNWCWAATSKSIIAYTKHNYPSQSTIVASVKGTPPPNQGANASQDEDSLTNFNVTTYYTPYNITFSQIMTDIGEYQPIKAAIAFRAGGGHALVIYGYSTAIGNSVSYMDPWDATFHTMSYDTFCSNSNWTWSYWTLYNND